MVQCSNLPNNIYDTLNSTAKFFLLTSAHVVGVKIQALPLRFICLNETNISVLIFHTRNKRGKMNSPKCVVASYPYGGFIWRLARRLSYFGEELGSGMLLAMGN